MISLKIDWFDLLAAQGTFRSLFQHHSSKASILWHSTFFTVKLSQLYMTTGKTIALDIWTFVGILSLLFNMLSRFVLAFLPRSKHLLISWLQSPSAVILSLTNLDSILKSRDTTLSTKVHLVKAVVFPVVIHGCESWTISKAECQRIDAFELWC